MHRYAVRGEIDRYRDREKKKFDTQREISSKEGKRDNCSIGERDTRSKRERERENVVEITVFC